MPSLKNLTLQRIKLEERLSRAKRHAAWIAEKTKHQLKTHSSEAANALRRARKKNATRLHDIVHYQLLNRPVSTGFSPRKRKSKPKSQPKKT
mgnify:FL=1